MQQSRIDRYSSIEQAFHWLTAILVLIAFTLGPGGHEERVYSAAHEFDRRFHETLGLSVLALTAIRLVWRTFEKRPGPPDVARWVGLMAKAVQLILYILLFLVPLTAMIGAWLEGHPLTLIGGMDIATPGLRTSHTIGEAISEIHTWLGDAIIWIAGLHACAALYHHFFLKDKVLLSMLPRRFIRRKFKS